MFSYLKRCISFHIFNSFKQTFFLEHVLLSLTRYFVVLPCLGHLLNFTILPIVFQTFGMGGGLYYDLLYPIAQISFGFSLTSTKLRYMRGVASESIVII